MKPNTRKTQAARMSVVSNVLLTLLKLGTALWTGSVSVLSEALHSATDLVASVIALWSVRHADRPPDEEHPFGHGKIETLSGLAEALLIFLAAGYILAEAVNKLRDTESHAPNVTVGLGVMAFSALVNAVISHYLKRVARETDSLALEADAAHLSTDVWTSLGVVLGLGLVHLTGKVWLDPLTGVLVALFILRVAWHLARDTAQMLIDVRLPVEEVNAIQKIFEADPHVLGYHKLRTRKAGSHRHVDVHVLMDDQCTLIEAHDLAEELEDRIRAVLPAMQINIHMEPYHAEIRHQHEKHGIPPPAKE